MPENNQMFFETMELDHDLLSTPFAIQTNWHVITGAPSSGKTTLINLLADKGFQTVPECARQYMEGKISRGRSIDEVHENAATLQKCIVGMQLRTENGLSATDVAFLDGAVPGSLSWYRVFGLNPNEILPDCFYYRYASVFVLDRLPLELNGFRFKDDAHTGFLDEWIVRDHSTLGYNVVRVPVLTPKQRLVFVLERLAEQGLI